MRKIKNGKSQQLLSTVIAVALTLFIAACTKPSPQELLDGLITAVRNNDIVGVEKHLEDGADPNLPNDNGDTPLSVALAKRSFRMFSKEENVDDNDILRILAFHGRRLKRDVVSMEGKLEQRMAMSGFDPSSGFKMVSHLYLDDGTVEREIAIGSYETRLKGIDVEDNVFRIKLGGEYRATGTIYDDKLEVDELVYLGTEKESSGFLTPGMDYLLSTWDVLENRLNSIGKQ